MDKGAQKIDALERLKIQKQQAERAVGQMLILPYASYEKRSKMGPGPSADYQGPMGYAGKGTKDRMPGTVTDDALKRVLKLFTPKSNSKKKSLAEQGFI